MAEILGLDFDDVLVAFAPHWQQYHQDVYGHLDSSLWGTPEGLRRGHEFLASHRHYLIPAVEGAVEAVSVLKRRRTLVIVTARDSAHADPTMRLMEKHFPKTFKGVHFLHNNLQNVLGTKGDVCKTHGIKEFADDSLAHLKSTHAVGVRSFLFTTPQNVDNEVDAGIIRVAGWKELLEHVK